MKRLREALPTLLLWVVQHIYTSDNSGLTHSSSVPSVSSPTSLVLLLSPSTHDSKYTQARSNTHRATRSWASVIRIVPLCTASGRRQLRPHALLGSEYCDPDGVKGVCLSFITCRLDPSLPNDWRLRPWMQSCSFNRWESTTWMTRDKWGVWEVRANFG